MIVCIFFLYCTATTEIYTDCNTLSLHDALPNSTTCSTRRCCGPATTREGGATAAGPTVDLVSASAGVTSPATRAQERNKRWARGAEGTGRSRQGHRARPCRRRRRTRRRPTRTEVPDGIECQRPAQSKQPQIGSASCRERG